MKNGFDSQQEVLNQVEQQLGNMQQDCKQMKQDAHQ